MKLPKTFIPNKDLEEKTNQLIKGVKINSYEDIEEPKTEYSFVEYLNLEPKEIAKAKHASEFYSHFECIFKYGGDEFHARHYYETRDKKRKIVLYLISLNGSKSRFNKLVKKIIKFNEKIGNSPQGDRRIYDGQPGLYSTTIQIHPKSFKEDFLGAFDSLYNKEFKNTRIDLILQNITREELQKLKYPKEKILRKVDEEYRTVY